MSVWLAMNVNASPRRPCVALAALVVATAAACGPGNSQGLRPAQLVAATRVDTFAGGPGRKVVPLASGGYMLLTQAYPEVETEIACPDRQLWWVDAAGQRTDLSAAWPHEVVLDVVDHPSGEVSVLTAAFEQTEGSEPWAVATVLRRLDAGGAAVPGGHRRLQTLLEGKRQFTTIDRARLVVDGDDLDVISLADEDAVFGQRVGRSEAGLVPGAYVCLLPPPRARLIPFGIAGGGRTVFGEANAVFVMEAARLADGTLVVAMAPERGSRQRGEYLADGSVEAATFAFLRHGEAPSWQSVAADAAIYSGGIVDGALVTSLAVMDDVAIVAGRVPLAGRGRGENGDREFRATLAWSDADGSERGHREVTAEPAAILLAVAAAPDGSRRLLVAGSENYTQNPVGASVSTDRQGFAAVLGPDGGRRHVLALPDGPRGGDARGVAWTAAGGALVTGSLDAPGTHDVDVRADGYVAWFAADALR